MTGTDRIRHGLEPARSTPDLPDYNAEILEELGLLLTQTPPGEWGELGLCPGPFGCPFETEELAIAAGARQQRCHARARRLLRGGA